ncbi:MAG: hypothetical protein QM767_10760 [Anaeromyxobacter sp.]
MPARSPSRPTKNVVRRPPNNVQRLREEQLLTKAELARKAGVSALTVARIEGGSECRMDTQRKNHPGAGPHAVGPAEGLRTQHRRARLVITFRTTMSPLRGLETGLGRARPGLA